MSLDHDFVLLDRETDGEWESAKILQDPRTLHLHDDLIRYMADSLVWIPTLNPSRNEPHQGLCMWGPTIIGLEGATIAKSVFQAWANLFALGPPLLSLTGNYCWEGDEDPLPGGDRVTQLEGGYEKLEFDRIAVVAVLRQLASHCEQVEAGGGRLYLLHYGV
jgi:hypothetical protein